MEIGQSITIQIEQKQDERKNLISKVIDKDEKYSYIDYPVNTSTGKTTMLLEGTSFTVLYRETDDNHLTFQSKVSVRKKINNIPVLGIEVPTVDEMTKIQRRNYLRMEAVLDVSVKVVDQHHHIPFTTTTVDISGGGCAIVIPKNISLEVDQIVHLWIVLPFKSAPYYYVNASAKVLRIKERNKGYNIAPLEFLSIKNKDRDQIVRFCFQKQVEQKNYS